MAHALAGMHLGSLIAVARQALAVYRSRDVDLTGWYERLHEMYRKAVLPCSETDIALIWNRCYHASRAMSWLHSAQGINDGLDRILLLSFVQVV
jgi:hypothetical protein